MRMSLSEAAALLRSAGIRIAGEPPPDREFLGVGIDSRTTLPRALFVALKGARFDAHDFIDEAADRKAAAALVERDLPGSRLPLLRVGDSLQALGVLASAWRDRFHDIKMVAITGSNGKTTVKEMVAAIFREVGPVCSTRGNFNNEIGVPLTLCSLSEGQRMAVLELGANHPGEIAALTRLVRPTVGVITQCAPAHLEGFGSLDAVARAKGELIEGLPDDAVAVINADDAYARQWRERAAHRRCLSFGTGNDADIRVRHADSGFIALDTPSGRIELTLALEGVHNALNAAAATAVAIACRIAAGEIRRGLASMRPVAGRLERKTGVFGERIIDDSYNANPTSLNAGIEVLAARSGMRWLVLGDMAELGPDAARMHFEAGLFARERGIDRLLAIGDFGRETVRAFGAGGEHFPDRQSLIRNLRRTLPPEATVLIKGSRSMGMERVVRALVEGGGD
ncbi:MAG: UDP-N-acetylmuramoyl-tripeptide--D-alanyl-D-alanine ligase [Ectothiorhodospiraceae bacterium AqS1]|nr:UDP-N-acetylmuramoyl-tripeptide--D-alanyl-D-alanine ligase [Ectothiorhodospiraceae bacterium AqS1]